MAEDFGLLYNVDRDIINQVEVLLEKYYSEFKNLNNIK